MKQAIFVAATPHRTDFLANFLSFMREYSGKYPIIIYSDYNFSKFDSFMRTTLYDEVLYLADSIEVKDLSLFDLIFEKYKGQSVSFTDVPYFLMGFGKWRRESYIKLPVENQLSYHQGADIEGVKGEKYAEIDGKPVILFPSLMDREHFDPRYEVKFNRENLILENEYIKKYKGHWHLEMTDNVDLNGYPLTEKS
jgi:hypothetical protein